MRNSSNSSMLYWLCARRLISCYPASWRERYADEMLLILGDMPPTPKTLFNLFLSLLDAYIHRDLVNERNPSMLQRMRSFEVVIYGATLFFFVSWLVAQRRMDVPGRAKVLLDFASSSLPVNIMHASTLILPLLILFGGLPILLVAGWQAVKTHRWWLAVVSLLSLLSPVVAAILAGDVMQALATTSLKGFIDTSISLCTFLIGLCISMVLISFVVRHVNPSRSITHYALYLATCVPVLMFIGLGALPFISFLRFQTIFTTGSLSYILAQVFPVLVMIASLLITLVALYKSFQARKDILATR